MGISVPTIGKQENAPRSVIKRTFHKRTFLWFPMGTKLGKNRRNRYSTQIIDLIPPRSLLCKIITQNQSNKYCSAYFTYDQLSSIMFGQLNRCLSLREMAMGIDKSPEFLSDMGLRQSPAKSNMSTGNKNRNYNIFAQLCYSLLSHYKQSLSHRAEYKVIDEIKNRHINIVDATIMSVCLKLFSGQQNEEQRHMFHWMKSC